MKMSLESKKELIKKVKARYLKSNKKEKSKILNELCINTELHKTSCKITPQFLK